MASAVVVGGVLSTVTDTQVFVPSDPLPALSLTPILIPVEFVVSILVKIHLSVELS